MNSGTPNLEEESHIRLIDLLRGVAALMVCYFHFSHHQGKYGTFLPEGNFLREIGTYGWLGVQVFFVISGFIIPYSLYTKHYALKNFWGFLKKRSIRIEPPYIATVLLILLNRKINGWLDGHAVDTSWSWALSHVFYLPPFLGQPWLNEIFWTLAIEVQFYIFMAFAFAGFIHKNSWVKLFTLVGFCLPYLFWPDIRFLTSYASLFLMGILAFWYRIGQINPVIYWVSLFVLMGYCSMQFSDDCIIIPVVSAVTSMLIAFVNLKETYGRLLGKISYSLYLTHGLIGGNFLLFLMYKGWAKEYEWLRMVMLFVAIILSVMFANLFYRIIERPSQMLSKKIKL